MYRNPGALVTHDGDAEPASEDEYVPPLVFVQRHIESDPTAMRTRAEWVNR